MSARTIETQANAAYQELLPSSEEIGFGMEVLTEAIQLGAQLQESVDFTADDVSVAGYGSEKYVGKRFIRVKYPENVEIGDCWVTTDSAHDVGTGLGRALDSKLKNGTSTTH